MTSPSTLPPPLSDAPSVETLERLLVGLHQPVERGVPSPPQPPAPPVAADAAPPPEAPAAVDRPPTLSWSAGPHRRSLRTTTAIGVALATAAGMVAGLVAAGEVPLP